MRCYHAVQCHISRQMAVTLLSGVLDNAYVTRTPCTHLHIANPIAVSASCTICSDEMPPDRRQQPKTNARQTHYHADAASAAAIAQFPTLLKCTADT